MGRERVRSFLFPPSLPPILSLLPAPLSFHSFSFFLLLSPHLSSFPFLPFLAFSGRLHMGLGKGGEGNGWNGKWIKVRDRLGAGAGGFTFKVFCLLFCCFISSSLFVSLFFHLFFPFFSPSFLPLSFPPRFLSFPSFSSLPSFPSLPAFSSSHISPNPEFRSLLFSTFSLVNKDRGLGWGDGGREVYG